MLDIYDGNNVLRRAMEKNAFIKAQPMTLRQRYEQACLRPQIWVWDGYHHNDRRRDIYPPYKMNREPTPENIYAQIKLFKEVLTMSPATQIEVYGWEADDVIGTLARRMRSSITIHTNDMDYAQLGHFPHVTLNGVDDKGVPARWIALYKAMVGDSSDNIDGIPNFGPKRWEQMEQWWPQIERAVVRGNPAGFAGLPFTPGVVAWLSDQANVDLLQAMLTVTHFENVPDDELEGGIKEGKMDRLRAAGRLAEFFL